MPDDKKFVPTEKDVRPILEALDSSGVLKHADRITRDEGKSELLAELSKRGLGRITPDMVVCNTDHWFFVVPPEPD
jgi:hypothetical protein